MVTNHLPGLLRCHRRSDPPRIDSSTHVLGAVEMQTSSRAAACRSGARADSPVHSSPTPQAAKSPQPGARSSGPFAAADGMVYCRRREMARLAVEPVLAPGWGLWWSISCRERDDSRGSRNRRSHSMDSSLVAWLVGCDDEAEQKLHWPCSRSCLQRSFMAGRTLRNP